MKTPIAFAAALSRQAARTSPKLGQGFVHHPSLPSINVISPSPTREAGPLFLLAPPSASTSVLASNSATGQRRQAVSFLARRAEQRDASLAPLKVSASSDLLRIEQLSIDKESGQPVAAEPVAATAHSTASAAAGADAWPSLHFATCECETCAPPTSRTYATPTANIPGLSLATSARTPAPTASPLPSSRRIQPIPRKRSTDDPAALRKKALRRVMQRRLKGRPISGSTTPTSAADELAVPTIMLNGSTVLVESAAAAKARVEGEWHVRWMATEYLRRWQRYGF